MRICPICGIKYTREPSISRVDNATPICPDCGIRQALCTIGVSDRREQDHIIDLVKKFEAKAGGCDDEKSDS